MDLDAAAVGHHRPHKLPDAPRLRRRPAGLLGGDAVRHHREGPRSRRGPEAPDPHRLPAGAPRARPARRGVGALRLVLEFQPEAPPREERRGARDDRRSPRPLAALRRGRAC